MKIDNQTKKTVAQIWLNAFPTLHRYSNTKLFKFFGPFIMGIELIRLRFGDDYQPNFVLYPLYGNSFGNDLKSCLRYSIMNVEFRDHKNFSFKISYSNYPEQTKAAIQSVREQLAFELDDAIPISSFYKMIDAQINNRLNIAGQKQYRYFEIKYHLALYKSIEEARKVLAEIIIVSDSWDMEKFSKFNGPFNDWFSRLENIKRDQMISIIQNNKLQAKVNKLQESELL